MPEQDHDVDARELSTRVLSDVSRSFYLTLRLLPLPMRMVTSVGYLLARATDTLADASTLPVGERASMIRDLLGVVSSSGGGRLDVADAIGRKSSAACELPGERVLMAKLVEVVRMFDHLGGGDRGAVGRVLGLIVEGQLFDLERFGGGGGDSHAGGPGFLESAGELERYAYLVAGSVGGFWTDRCRAHLGDALFGSSDADRIEALGVSYGCGLQLVNILRDVAADLQIGRCYLPRDEIVGVGIDPADVKQRPEALLPVARAWQGRCRRHLLDGVEYVRCLRPGRVRYATALPVLFGLRTLRAVEAAGPAVFHAKVKIPRAQVKRLAIAAIGAAWSDRVWLRLAY